MRKLVQDLTRALETASHEIEESCCTCVSRSEGHQRGCRGVLRAKAYDKLVARAKKTIASELTKS